jgi:hypothetical protein
LIVALTRLRRAAQLAAGIPELNATVAVALVQFDNALPGLKAMRDVAEHIDEYAIDQGRKKSVARQSLEVSALDDEGPTLNWLGNKLNALEAIDGSRTLFAVIQDAARLLPDAFVEKYVR